MRLHLKVLVMGQTGLSMEVLCKVCAQRGVRSEGFYAWP